MRPIQVWVCCIEGWAQEITEIIGRFNFEQMCTLQSFLIDEGTIPTVPESTDENAPTERLCLVDWEDGETQYGTGYGDVHVIAGYYDITPTQIVR